MPYMSGPGHESTKSIDANIAINREQPNSE